MGFQLNIGVQNRATHRQNTVFPGISTNYKHENPKHNKHVNCNYENYFASVCISLAYTVT